jgi:hypothetical protein
MGCHFRSTVLSHVHPAPAPLVPDTLRAKLAVCTSGMPGWETLFPIQPTPDFPIKICHEPVARPLATPPSATLRSQADLGDIGSQSSQSSQSKAAEDDGNASRPYHAKSSGHEEQEQESFRYEDTRCGTYAFMLGQNDFEMSPEEADLWHGGVQCSTHTFIQGEIESESESEDG